jgi:hypothetical protein
VKVCKISTHDNSADMMTEPIPIAKFELCSSLVGVTHYRLVAFNIGNLIC